MAQGRKTGGRAAGTPNKSTGELKAFLERVFARAQKEKRVLYAHGVIRRKKLKKTDVPQLQSLEDRLVDQVITLTLDPKLHVRYLEYLAGKPTTPIELGASKDLAAIIAGVATDSPEEDA